MIDTEITTIINQIGFLIGAEGYLSGDFFKKEPRILNTECFSLRINRRTTHFVIDLDLCNLYLANIIEEYFEDFGVSQPVEIKIKVGTRKVSLLLKPSEDVKRMTLTKILPETKSSWLKTPGVLDLAALTTQKATLSIYKLDSDTGFPCVEVLPKLGIEKVLSIPRHELLYQPVLGLPSKINTLADSDRKRIHKVAEVKHKILEDLSSGKEESAISYTVIWSDPDDPTMDSDTIWRHRYVGRVLSNTGEAVLTGFSEEGWQDKYWEKLTHL